MDPITQQAVLATAGAAAAGGDPVYVDDVFSTFLYDGNSTARPINNDIDLSGEGGLVWIRTRAAGSHRLVDTERTATKRLSTDSNNPEGTDSSGLTSFTSTGFTLGAGGDYNDNNDYVSWTFRKAPGFFDIVTWTGNSVSGRQIAHNLGSAPGFIMVKSYVAGTGGTGWMCYHRSLGNTKAIRMDNGSGETAASSAYWNNTDPTSTHFTVGNNEDINTSANSRSYVAYVFAHDSQVFGTDSDEAIIKCGSYTGNLTTPGPIVNLGWEPQWVMIKSTGSAPWLMFDSMRGIVASGSSYYLPANDTDAEDASTGAWGGLRLTPTGFQVDGNTGDWMNASGQTYIYMAIRRPHKPPTAATDVFSVIRQVANSATFQTGFPVDWTFSMPVSSQPAYGITRLTGDKYLTLGSSAAEGSTGTLKFDDNEAFAWGPFWATEIMTGSFFRRAPGFFDVVTYTGTLTSSGSASVAHSLKAIPELIITKQTDGTSRWTVQHKDLADNHILELNQNYASALFAYGDLTTRTSSVFSTNYTAGMNTNNDNFIAYLFATLPGISKVGSYSGTGNAINVDCGFTAGARFILIKRTDSTGDWYVWTSADGIVSGDDPYWRLNDTTGSRTTNTDYVDPLSTGFTVTASAPAALNASGGSYIFLAIA